MTTRKVEIDIPEAIVQYTVLLDKEALLKRNAMLVYPYIQDGSISHGKAAEMIGIGKMDLIVLYGKMGLPYFDESDEELEDDIDAIKSIRGEMVC
ncbi:MAG: UPF0175 family protein [Lachnospiraceae bacterium]|nr:UPF0175 family protein [Lachnospiraceae bacterium]MBQ2981605.1 UPF0175 family protein [Lachnospiraceae bacterium]